VEKQARQKNTAGPISKPVPTSYQHPLPAERKEISLAIFLMNKLSRRCRGVLVTIRKWGNKSTFALFYLTERILHNYF